MMTCIILQTFMLLCFYFEHINCIMKVTGGLVGITQNASARERFFLTAPELSRLAEEAHAMAGTPTATRKEHHDLSVAVWTRQEENIARLKSVLRSSINPMKDEGENLTNIITTVVRCRKMCATKMTLGSCRLMPSLLRSASKRMRSASGRE